MARELIDLDAFDAQRDEALDAPFEFSFKGEKYTVPAGTDWPLEFSDVAAEKGTGAAFHLLVGEDQWQRLRAAGLRNRHANHLFEQITAQAGVDAPS